MTKGVSSVWIVVENIEIELAYALSALRDSSESWLGSAEVDADDCVLCMEKRLDCELEGVRTGFEV